MTKSSIAQVLDLSKKVEPSPMVTQDGLSLLAAVDSLGWVSARRY